MFEVKVVVVNFDERKIDLLLDKFMLCGFGGKKVKVKMVKKLSRNVKWGLKGLVLKGKGVILWVKKRG